MSTDYGCAFGDASHQVNWLLTHLSPALTVSVCDDDFPLAVIPLLASALGVDQGRLYESVKRFVDREQAREAKAARQGGPTEIDRLDPGTESSEPPRCESCGRVAGMPTEPCASCPDYGDPEL